MSPKVIEELAWTLDEVEAELTTLRHKLWLIRRVLQGEIQKRVGYQYGEDER